MRDPDFTLSAGPVTTSHRVNAALGGRSSTTTTPPSSRRFRRTEERVKELFRTKNDVAADAGRGDPRARGGAARTGHARNEGAEPRPGRLREGHRLLAQGHGRGTARDRSAVQRRGRSGGRRALHGRTPRDRARDGRALRDSVGDVVRRRRDRPDRPRARRADDRRRRVVGRRHAARGRRVAPRRRRRRCAEVPRRPSRDDAHVRERGRLGARPRRTRPHRAPPTCRCSTGRRSGSTATGSRSRRPSARSTASRRPSTSCSRRGSRTRSRGTSAPRRPAAPASARWGSRCGPRATRSPGPARPRSRCPTD